MAESSETQRVNAALTSQNARLVLLAYMEDRLKRKQAQLMLMSKEQFEVHKGRCLELQELINELIEGRMK